MIVLKIAAPEQCLLAAGVELLVARSVWPSIASAICMWRTSFETRSVSSRPRARILASSPRRGWAFPLA